MATDAPRRATLLILALLTSAPFAHAQSNDEIQTATQFDLFPPGARSLALGGAFVALADDATAAYSNPAGLTQLVEPEVAIEARHGTFRSQFAERGHVPETALTGIGIDVVDGLQRGEERNRAAGLAFASFTYPGTSPGNRPDNPAAKRWAVAIYGHQLTRFRSSLTSQGLFVGPRSAPFRTFPVRSSLDLDIAGIGAAGAYRLRDDFSVGFGLASYHLDLDSTTERFRRAEPTGDLLQDGLTGQFYGPADFSPENVFNRQLQRGSDDDLVFQAGFLWRLDSRWSLGGAYRQGPSFDFRAEFVEGPAGEAPGRVDPTVGGQGTFRVPDVAALGVALHATDQWLITADYDWIRYSSLSDGLLNLLRAAIGAENDFVIDDAHQLHLGTEIQLLEPRFPVALRAGLWWDPDHRLRYVGDEALLAARFRAGDDELHLTAGAGIVFGRAQIDLAVDHADPVTTVSLSAVARF
ncbi:MAG: outer membrane protein transport protein [Acidobacteriota bacterium]